MNYVKNIINDLDYANTSLLFIAEGFTAQQEQLFYSTIFDIYDRISSYECFTKLKQDNSKIAFLSLYVPSANSGTATSASSAIGNTILESYIDAQGLHIDYNKLETLINDSIIIRDGEEQLLSENLIIMDDYFTYIVNDFIIPIVIFPDSTMPHGELEHIESNHFYYIATTLDNYYEQIVIRGLAKISGLGDEFDVAGLDFEQPEPETGEKINIVHPNLFYTEDANNLTYDSDSFKWVGLFPESATSAVNVHPHPSSGTVPDRNLPAIPFSYKTIEMWEGGGLYRKYVYRPSVDCLLRRKIGESTLPVKDKRVSLCPICMRFLEKLI